MGALGLRSIYRSSTGARGRATSAWLRHVRILPLPITNAPFRELSAKSRMPLRGVVGSPNRSPRRFAPPRHNEPSPILPVRSEEHTSELQSLMLISYTAFCLKNKKYKY